jgi:hypothetical protein
VADQDDCRQRCKEEGAEMKDIPAFPHSFVRHPTEETYITKGMTLRDYFAAKAMQALISEPSLKATMDEFAHRAYQIADIMMEERQP